MHLWQTKQNKMMFVLSGGNRIQIQIQTYKAPQNLSPIHFPICHYLQIVRDPHSSTLLPPIQAHTLGSQLVIFGMQTYFFFFAFIKNSLPFKYPLPLINYTLSFIVLFPVHNSVWIYYNCIAIIYWCELLKICSKLLGERDCMFFLC